MSLATLAEVRGLVETDLADASMQILLDDAEAEIVRRFGPHASDGQVDTIEAGSYDPLTSGNIFGGEDYVYGRDRLIFPARRVASVNSITETVGMTDTVLDASDYRLIDGGRRILRWGAGANPRIYWGHRVVVDYIPVDDSAQRKRVQIDLVRLSIQYNALASVKIGDYQQSGLDYEHERHRLLARLGGRAWA